jgi:TIR domain
MAETRSAFFSYSRQDSEFALKLAKDLKDRGAMVWLDQLDIAPGQHWDSAVEQALANCPDMLLVLSPASVASDNVMDEVSFALDEHKLLIPVLHQTCNIPFRLRRVQYIDFRANRDRALAELLNLLGAGKTAEKERATRTLEQDQVALVPAVEPPSPQPSASNRTSDANPGDQPHKPSRSRFLKILMTAAALVLAFAATLCAWHWMRPEEPVSRAWVQKFVNDSQSPPVSKLRPFFDDTVSPYYGLRIAHWSDVVRDKETFFRDHPTIQYTLGSDLHENKQLDGTRALHFELAYEYARASGKHETGTTEVFMTVRAVDGQWRITGIQEKDTRRGGLPASNPR